MLLLIAVTVPRMLFTDTIVGWPLKVPKLEPAIVNVAPPADGP